MHARVASPLDVNDTLLTYFTYFLYFTYITFSHTYSPLDADDVLYLLTLLYLLYFTYSPLDADDVAGEDPNHRAAEGAKERAVGRRAVSQ